MDNLVKEKAFKKNLKAPIHKGDIVGTLTVQKGGKVIVKSNLVAKENVKSAGWWKLFKRSFGLFTKS